MSNVYLARPEAFSWPSMREIRLPIKRRSFASGQSYLHFAMTFSSPPAEGRPRENSSTSGCLRGRSAARGFEHGVFDAVVGAATAQVPAQTLLHLFERRVRVLVQERAARHHEAGSA